LAQLVVKNSALVTTPLAFKQLSGRDCRLSRRYRNPSSLRAKDAAGRPTLTSAMATQSGCQFGIRSVATRLSKKSSPPSRRTESAGSNWREAARDEIFPRIINGAVDRRGRKITEFVFRFCIAGKMWTPRHLHGFARHKRSPVRPDLGGSFAGASGEKAEPMGRIKAWCAVARVGFDIF